MGSPPKTDYHMVFFFWAFASLATLAFVMMFTTEDLSEQFKWMVVSFICDGAAITALHLDQTPMTPRQDPPEPKTEKSEDSLPENEET